MTIRAGVHTIGGYSAHADQDDLLDFIQGIPTPPQEIRLVHGEGDARASLKVLPHPPATIILTRNCSRPEQKNHPQRTGLTRHTAPAVACPAPHPAATGIHPGSPESTLAPVGAGLAREGGGHKPSSQHRPTLTPGNPSATGEGFKPASKEPPRLGITKS
nr:MBL fold metallo-hydrolase RNA specificity domain-containing protein [Ectothiorhodospira marina]